MHIVATLTDGPVAGERIEVDTGISRKPPVLVTVEVGVYSHRYRLARATDRAWDWIYEYESTEGPA